MTIEAQLERIADALEALNGTRTIAPSEQEGEALQQEATKSESKKPAKPSSDDINEAPTLDDVRDALKALQIVTDAGTSKAILAEHGAKTLSKLDTSAYGELIAAANAAAEEAADE
jgi:hypothetical protein